MAANKETRLSGRAVSRGIAVGSILCLYGTRRQFFRRTVDESETGVEVERLDAAIAEANKRLESDITNAKATSLAEILQTHKYILLDPSLRSTALTNISNKRMNAEWAVQSAIDAFGEKLADASSGQIQEKRLDLEDVFDRILACLGTSEIDLDIKEHTIIAASELSPSMFVTLAEKGIAGVISESGGWTSHTSILARELAIPAITGLTNLFDHLEDGMRVSIDGFSGEVVIDPIEADGLHVSASADHSGEFDPSINKKQFSTADGRTIAIRTNTTTVKGYAEANRLGAEGIGLFRSEALISKDGVIPSEDEQAKYYSEIAEAVGEAGVHIRTFDLDAGQYVKTNSLRQKNPALGLRAIRLGLMNDDLLKTQIRALLRAADGNNIGLVIPMVSGVADVLAVKNVIGQVTEELNKENVAHGDLQLGTMIEIPSSVLVVDQLAEVSDFFCLGTNDLAQYTLAADRDNETVSRWFRTLHPAMLRSVRKVIDECRNADKPLVVCGEMAGSPFYVPVLIGLGATELSMNPSSIGAVSKVVSGINYSDAVELARELEKLSDPDAMDRLVAETAKDKWSGLFAPGFLDLQTS